MENAPQGAGRTLLHKRRLAHFLADPDPKGGGAYGTWTLDESPAFPSVLHHCAVADDSHGPKSVLTAWMAPSGQYRKLY